MLLVDTNEGRIIGDQEIKQKLATEYPYRDWLNKYQVFSTTCQNLKPRNITQTDHASILNEINKSLAILTKNWI